MRKRYNKRRFGKKYSGRSWWSRLNTKERLMFFFPAAAAIAAILIVMFVNSQAERFTIEDLSMRYYAGNSYSLEENTVLLRTSDDTTVVEWDGGEYVLDTLPIYYYNENTVLFANNMVYIEPRMDDINRLDYFTEVTVSADESVYAKRDGEEVFLKRGFAYDGGDIYIFFETVILEFNGYRMELPPLSYVEAVFTGEVMVYNGATGDQYMEAPKTDVLVIMEGSDFTLSLLDDSMEASDGTKRLIFTKPEQLDSIF